MRTSLVLGGGGTVGIAYHAGVLRALEEVGGFPPGDADLVVGTSAGSMAGAIVRSGVPMEEFFALVTGTHDDVSMTEDDEPLWSATFAGPTDVLRRAIGSMYVLNQSLLRLPQPRLPRRLQRLFPGGFFAVPDGDDRVDFVGTEWPDKPLWLVTVDVRTGRRVVLGRRNPPRCDLRTAVTASCAIPAFFQPVRVGVRTLVDGGVHSGTNLDLANKIEPDLIVVVAPMNARADAGACGFDRAVRGVSNRSLATEIAGARRRGTEVIAIEPTRADLAAFGGLNMMRRDGLDRVAHVAYESAAQILSGQNESRLLAERRESADLSSV